MGFYFVGCEWCLVRVFSIWVMRVWLVCFVLLVMFWVVGVWEWYLDLDFLCGSVNF